MSDCPADRKPSYNFMNDDIDNDIEIQIIPVESHDPFVLHRQSSSSSLAENLQEKLYYLQQTSMNLQKGIYLPKSNDNHSLLYDSLSNSPLSLSGNSSLRGSDQRGSDQRGSEHRGSEHRGSEHRGSEHREYDINRSQREYDITQNQRDGWESVVGTDIEENRPSKRTTYKKLTYEEIEHSIQKNYKNEKLASQLDILITFVKGQKHIYTQSYNITKQKINALVFPSLIISGSMMVVAPLIQSIIWSGYLLSALNALLTIFTSMLNFWDLQSDLSQYNTCATHFDRLETSLVMTRNNLFLMDNFAEKNDKILTKLKETETRMMEMKEENSILVPPEIQLEAPIISHIDIFSFIHKIENQMKGLLVEYKDTKNEIRYIMYKWKTRNCLESLGPSSEAMDPHINDSVHYEMKDGLEADNHMYYRSFMNLKSSARDADIRKEHERHRLQLLLSKKDTLKQRILDQYKKYAGIEQVFSDEIQYAENVSYFFYWGFCRRKRNVEPILREFMKKYEG